MQTYLNNSCANWDSNNFSDIFNCEIKSLDISQLPLQQGLSHSSIALNDKLKATILEKTDLNDCYSIRAGLFYTGIISGCSCADDPSPQDEITEYCEALFLINKQSAETTITLIQT